MKPSSVDIPLHDIKPLVEISDHSLMIFIGLISIGLIIIIALLYLLWRYIKERRQVNYRRECYKSLEAVALSKPKTAAYAITRYGLCFADDSPRLKEAYLHLTSRLFSYKYKKEVGGIDQETIGFYRIYLEMIDV